MEEVSLGDPVAVKKAFEWLASPPEAQPAEKGKTE
jgi:hypothetical protein